MKGLLILLFVMGLISLQAQAWFWATTANNSVMSTGHAVCVTKNESTGVGGSFFSNALPIGTLTLPNSGNQDGFLARLNKNGSVLWAKAIGGTGNEYVADMACDQIGNFYAVGVFNSSTCMFGIQALSCMGSSDGFVAKYDSLGSIQWVTQVSGPGQEAVTAVTVDTLGNIYATGQTNSGLLVVNTATHSPGTPGRMFTLKLDAHGQSVWAVISGGSGPQDKPNELCIDPAGNLYVAGSSNSDSFVAGTFSHTFVQTTPATFRYFSVKYDNAGNVQWLQASSSGSMSEGVGAGIDKTGAFYTAGHFASASLNIGSHTMVNGGQRAAFLARHHPSNGNIVWSQVSSGADAFVAALGVGDTGIFMAGSGSFPVTFNGAVLTTTAANAQWLLRFDGAGNSSCGSVVANSNFRRLAIGPAERVYISGDYNGGPLVLDQLTEPAGNSNVMVATKYACKCISGFGIQSNHAVLCLQQTAVLTAGSAVSYSWSTNANTQTVAISPLQTTSYSVTAGSPEGCLQRATYTQSVTVCNQIPDEPVAVLKLFPNPISQGQFLQLNSEDDIHIAISDISGKRLIESADSNSIQKFVAGLPAGLYFVHVVNGASQAEIQKVVVQ